MAKLVDVLLGETHRAKVIDDCVRLVEQEVSNKGGLSGIAVKGAFGIIKRLKPSIVRDSVERLLEDFAKKLDPFVPQEAAQVREEFNRRKNEVAEALLSITDARADSMEAGPLKAAYSKLRPAGLKHVEAAVPGISEIIAKYV